MHTAPVPGIDAQDSSSATPKRSGCGLWLGVTLAVPACVLLLGFLSWSLSLFSGVLGCGLALLTLGLVAQAFGWRGAVRLLAAGTTVTLGALLFRAVLVRNSERVTVEVVPEGGGPRLVNKLYPEGDGALIAAKLLVYGNRLHDVESASFADILRDAYTRTDPPAENVPTPAIATYLQQQSAERFDVMKIAPPPSRAASSAPSSALDAWRTSRSGGCSPSCSSSRA